MQDGVLKNADGDVFTIDVLLVQKGFDRIFAPYARKFEKPWYRDELPYG